MHQIILVPNNSGANAALFYQTREKAEIEYQNIHEMLKKGEPLILTAKDDFGVWLAMPIANVSYALLGDISKQNELRALQGEPRR